MPLQSAEQLNGIISKSIKYTCLPFLELCNFSSVSEDPALLELQRDTGKLVSSGLGFSTLNKGFTNVTNR